MVLGRCRVRGNTLEEVRFAISIPQYARDSLFDEAAFRSHLARVDELAVFESGWVQEQVMGGAGVLASLQTLTYAAACTQRLRLGCAVFILPLHNPLHLAKAISSLDCLSHGRVEVGVATGGKERPFAAFGVDPDRPVARFNEALALMKSCWTESRSTSRALLDAPRSDDGAQAGAKPYPPVWFGGNAPAGMRRAARHGDGFMGAGSQTTARYAEQVAMVKDELAAQERDPEKFRFGKRVYVHVDDDFAVAQGGSRTPSNVTTVAATGQSRWLRDRGAVRRTAPRGCGRRRGAHVAQSA